MSIYRGQDCAFCRQGTPPAFLEPEGRHTDEIYVQGLSTSLPEDVQRELVHSIKGLENAQMMQQVMQLGTTWLCLISCATLETKRFQGCLQQDKQTEHQATKADRPRDYCWY